MDKRVKTMWLTALRGDKYRQGITALRHSDKFCCLGVLCDLYVKDTGLAWWRDDYIIVNDEGLFGASYLPIEVQAWAGMRDARGAMDNQSDDLSEMNDRGMTFSEIADVIEENF